MEPFKLKGGCNCGAVRYEVRVAPGMSGYCHCRICQRTTGAPAVAWAQVPVAAFSYTAREPTVFVSSDSGERRFCSHCGGQIEFRRRPDPKTVEFYLATLDDPSQVVPQFHIFTQSRIPWFDTTDQLPRLLEMG